MKLFVALLLAVMLYSVHGCSSNGPLGMISGEIQDWQISASSSYPSDWDKGCNVKFARPYLQNGQGWCARMKSSSEWLQIDLGVLATVTGIITQGRGDGKEWVTTYQISYSPDGEVWDYVMDGNNGVMVFQGNSDSYSDQHAYLPEAVDARYIKLQVASWHNHPSMRVELIGCQDNKQYLGRPPYSKLSASSARNSRDGSTCQAEDGHILTGKAWCAKALDKDQWLQLDIGPPTLVTTLVTRGRGDTGKKQWVTFYRISYSNDSETWQFYRGNEVKMHDDDEGYMPANRRAADGVVEFGGNYDKTTPRVQYLAHPFVARFVRFHPIEWYRGIALRAGVMGRPHTGDCGLGFTRPNKESACIENIAFKKETWMYKERHSKRALIQEKATDGITTNDIRLCPIIDSYYSDDQQLQLTIDLGRRQDVSGVIIYMWDGETDRGSPYTDYAKTLGSLTVHVSSSKTERTLCGRLNNDNNQFSKNREQKLNCGRRISGRYIRVSPQRRDGSSAWSKDYRAVICEVMAYT